MQTNKPLLGKTCAFRSHILNVLGCKPDQFNFDDLITGWLWDVSIFQ